MNQVPLYFVKSLSALCFSGSRVPYPKNSDRMWTEVELGIIISKDCIDVSIEEAHNYVAGYTVCADVTCENLHGRDHHLGFSKSRKNFCPVLDQIVDISQEQLPDLSMTTEINGQITQQGLISDMRYDVMRSISLISSITMLKKGDLILTGTPSGVENNIVLPGDHVKQRIDGIGEIQYQIVKD